MKKALLFSILLILSLFAGCGETMSSQPATGNSAESSEICISTSDLMVFNNLEEFLHSAESATVNGDIADLAALTQISVPTGLPEGYTLYKITAGASDIAFWYLPEEYLTDEAAALEAEALQKHFLFMDSRGSYDFDKVLNQFGGDRAQLIDNKYFVFSTTTENVIWEENGNVFWLYLPSEITVSNLVTFADEGSSNTAMAYDLLDSYCEIETIVIRNDPRAD